jgi:glycosyltransferase involved in cell wall biosynthesis
MENNNQSELLIVMPVYNEEASVRKVVLEWFTEIEQWTEKFTFLIIDDGSKDSTPSRLEGLAQRPRAADRDHPPGQSGPWPELPERVSARRRAEHPVRLSDRFRRAVRSAVFLSLLAATRQMRRGVRLPDPQG